MFGRIRLMLCGLLLLGTAADVSFAQTTQNVLVVMTDGLRWQEVFNGAEDRLLTPKDEGEKKTIARLRADYWRPTVEERREALMPFLWKTVAKEGQLYGDRSQNSDAHVTNGLNFSYPGYSETLVGYPDPRVDSNDNKPNPNVTVLEWLNKKPAFHDRVAAFGAWAVINGIVNKERCGFVVNAGYDPFQMEPMTPELTLLNQIKNESPRVWDDEPFDAPVFHTAIEYLKAKKPRVLYLSLGETDDWAHGGRYGDYLDAAHRVDAYLEELWNLVQSMPEYKGKTSLVVLTDHGRGATGNLWTSHGQKIPESKEIWMAFLGPNTPALGNKVKQKVVTQNQTAATIAALLGEDYKKDVPKVGEPITDVTSKK